VETITYKQFQTPFSGLLPSFLRVSTSYPEKGFLFYMAKMIKCSLCEALNEVKHLIRNNDNCISCGKNAGIMKLTPPKQGKKHIDTMPFGKFKGRSIRSLVQNERWYIDFLLSVDISHILRQSILSYL
jgi:hypothetical protein